MLRPGKLSIIGNGVVLDPHALVEEIERLKTQNVTVTPDNLRIAENTTLILPLHRELDALRESSNELTRIGTTRRGIGPAYEDKVGRRAIRLMDLADGATLDAKIERLLAHHNALRRGLGLEARSAGAIRDDLMQVAPRVLPFMDTVWSLLDAETPRGQAHPVRGRPRRAPRRRSRHLSLRHVVEHGRRAGRHRLRRRTGRHRLCARHLQGLYYPRR